MESSSNLIKTYYIDEHILHISLNRPQALNALNADLMQELLTLLLEAKKNPKIKALLLTGEGKAFCAGADITQLAALKSQSGLRFARLGQMIFRTLEQLGKPSLAAIQGFALGGGCELAMAATLRIAAQTASFGQPEVKLGVIPGFGGTQRLARLIGKGRALDMCITGKMIKAPDALQWGLITEMVEPENLLSRATEIAKSLLNLAPLAIQSIMDVIDQGFDLSLADAFELEAVHFGLCCASLDKAEGVEAFLEKRSPKFIGE
ncbi:MAG: enoyl-CoA hydratase-related protein [Gammaproteobacteria bacterium]|nr:enoyl-CoA hydratase-related protein [Gammaproteobacteria bacterium]